MDIQRITISIPGYIYQRLRKAVPRRGISRFVAESVEKQLLNQPKENSWEEFFKLRDKMPKLSTKRILAAIRKGRM